MVFVFFVCLIADGPTKTKTTYVRGELISFSKLIISRIEFPQLLLFKIVSKTNVGKTITKELF